MAQIQFLAIGELLADFISSDYVNDLSQARTFQLHTGGSPSNVCANLKWLGINSALISCVGQDTIGDFLIGEIKKTGISTDHIIRSRTHPTSVVLVARSQGTPDFIAYRSADTQLGQIDRNLLRESNIIHTCAFALSRNPAQHHILEALSWATSQHKTISIDWNYAPAMWESNGAMVFRLIGSMHPLLKVSVDDVSRFAGSACSADDAKNFLASIPAKVTCLTCGKDGVWYKELKKENWFFEPATLIPDVKDTTGAGDAFWSGFISAYIRNSSLSECVQQGIRIAAKKIQTFGPLYHQPK